MTNTYFFWLPCSTRTLAQRFINSNMLWLKTTAFQLCHMSHPAPNAKYFSLQLYRYYMCPSVKLLSCY